MIRNGTTLPGRSPAHQEVVGALDQACAIWGLAGGDSRSRFIQHCLRYGLLSLLDAGVLELPEAAEPKLVCHYREMEARLSAAGASAIEQPTPPEFTESKRAFQRATESFRQLPVQRASRPAPAPSRLRFARRFTSSECFQEFRPRPEKSDPAPQHPRNLRNRMLRHLACQHSGGDRLQPCIMSGLKKPLPLRVGVPDQRLPTTAQANRLLEPADFGHDPVSYTHLTLPTNREV